MIKEVIAEGTTISIAIENGVNEIGVDKDLCQIEILETPKRTLFGRSKKAVVKITTEIVEEVVEEVVEKIVEKVQVDNSSSTNDDYTPQVKENSTLVISDLRNGTKTELAVAYLTEVLRLMKLEHITMTVEENEDNANITFDGEGMAVLIGYHGETLDSLQYLTTLTCNRDDGDYYRISLDCGNYRQKRETTLQNLATKIGTKVRRTGKSQMLEPMSSYERKVIHAVIADMEGVYSKSKGDEPNRKVLVLPDKNNNNMNYSSGKTMEQILKEDKID